MGLDFQSEYPSRYAPRLLFYLSSTCRARTLHGEVAFISGTLPSFLHSAVGLYKRCQKWFNHAALDSSQKRGFHRVECLNGFVSTAVVNRPADNRENTLWFPAIAPAQPA